MSSYTSLLSICMAGFLSLLPLTLCAQTNANYAGEGIQTQGLYVRDSSFDQPIIGVKITGNVSGQPFWRLSATLSEGTNPAMLSNYKLYKTNTPYFAPAIATELVSSFSPTVSGRTITFDYYGANRATGTVSTGDTIWLTARIADNATPGVEIDASINYVHVNGIVCTLTTTSPTGAGMTTRTRAQVLPYFRPSNGSNWNDAYFDVITGVIIFGTTVNADGTLNFGGEFAPFVEKLRSGRGERHTRLLLCICFSKENFSAIAADATKRETFANQLCDALSTYQLDGVDLDWEYPESAADWNNLPLLYAAIRPKLFALGGGKTLTAALSGWNINAGIGLTSDAKIKSAFQQLDALHMMSYDNSSTDGHSPFWLMTNDISTAQASAGMPASKVIAGLPFYTNKLDNFSLNDQRGYNSVYSTYPDYVDAQDIIPGWNGNRHSYNSIATIRRKADYIRDNAIGGAMIWAYDTDIAYSNPKSLAANLALSLAPHEDLPITDGTITSADQWGSLAGNVTLAADITLDAMTTRCKSFTGTLDGAGHTITLQGGAPLITGGCTGNIKNLNIHVTGDMSGAPLAQALTSTGKLENVTVTIDPEVTLTAVNSIGGLVGELYCPSADNTATITNCSAVIAGTLVCSGNGRTGGLVGNFNCDAVTPNASITRCSVELLPTATLKNSEAIHPGVGGLVGNCNHGYEIVTTNAVTLHAGATLSSANDASVGALIGGSSFGTISATSDNLVLQEVGSSEYGQQGVSSLYNYTVGAWDPVTKLTLVTYTNPTTGMHFTLRLPINYNIGYRFILQ